MRRYIPITAALVSVCLLCSGCTSSAQKKAKLAELEKQLESTVTERQLPETDDITSLRLDVDMSEVVVRTGERWKLESNFKKEYLTCEAGDGVLTIRQPDFNWSFGGWSGKLDPNITLTVPEDLRLDTLDVELNAGAMELKDLSAKESRLDVDAGAITLDALDTRSLDLDCDTGGVEGTLRLTRNSSMDVDMGAIELTLLEGSKVARVAADIGLGSVSFNGEELDDGAEQKIGTNGGQLQLNCDMGSIELNTEP